MRRAVRFYGTSIGKKVAMAVSGVVLVLFLVAHMAGNLKVFQGQMKFDAYAGFLREVGAPVLGHGEALWLFRAVLIAAVTLHIVAAAQLWSRSRRARRVPYGGFDDLSFSYASRTMRWGGVILALFVLYHLLHLTAGTVHPDFDHGSAYRNVVVGFQVWWVVLVYVAAVVALGLHLYHGLWSGTQTLGLHNARLLAWRRPAAAAIAGLLVAGYVSVPLAVLAGILR